MAQQIRTSGDIIIDNVDYMCDMLEDMINTLYRAKEFIPQRTILQDISLSQDVVAVNNLNRAMADTQTLVWSIERTKDLLVDFTSELMPDAP